MRTILFSLSTIGLGLMGYLFVLHERGGAGSVCEIGERFSCEIVNSSIFSELFGVSVALFGMALFLSIIFLILGVHAPSVRYSLIGALLVASLIFSIRLTYIEFFVLDSICLFCELSKLLMLGMLGVTLFAARRERARLYYSWMIIGGLLGAGGTIVAHIFQKM